jgi:hypothetical protein
MSKYAPLGNYLREQPFSEVPMTFAEIERVTGIKLPPKAQSHRAWWSNSPSNNVMTKVWLDAGFRSERVDMAARKLVFRRVHPKAPTPGGGMNEGGRPFKPQTGPEQPRRHPIFGAMKGWFTIEKGYDLTQPAMPEWTEMLDEKYGPESQK